MKFIQCLNILLEESVAVSYRWYGNDYVQESMMMWYTRNEDFEKNAEL